MSTFQQLSIFHPRVTRWQDFQGSPVEAWVFFSEPLSDTGLATASFISTEGQLDLGYFHLVSWKELRAGRKL